MKRIMVLVVAVMLLLALAAPAFAARGGEQGPDILGKIHSGYTSDCTYKAEGSEARDCR